MALSLKFKIMHAYYLTRITVSLAGLHIVCIDSYNFAIRIRIFFSGRILLAFYPCLCEYSKVLSISSVFSCSWLSLVWFDNLKSRIEMVIYIFIYDICVYLAFYVCTIGLMKPSNTLE